MAEQMALGRAEIGEDERLARLEAEVQTLTREVGRLQDVQAIRILQHTYGYFMDKGLYDEVVDLFAEDGQLRFMGGVFKGKAGVRRLYCGRLRPGFTGKNGPAFGMLCDHMQLQDAIHVAPDGLTARGRFRALLIGGMGSVLAPLAGAWMLDARLSTIAILGLLAVPALVCALGVGVMRPGWQAH